MAIKTILKTTFTMKILTILILSTSFLSCKKDKPEINNLRNLLSVNPIQQIVLPFLDNHIKTSIIKGDTTINTFDNSNVIGYVIADKTDLTKVTLIYVGKIKKLTLYGKKTIIGSNILWSVKTQSGAEVYNFTTDVQQTHAWNFNVSNIPVGISTNSTIDLSYLACMRYMFDGCFSSWGCGISCGVRLWVCSQGWSLTCVAAVLQ